MNFQMLLDAGQIWSQRMMMNLNDSKQVTQVEDLVEI